MVSKRFLQNQTTGFEAQRGKQPLEKIESIIINLSEEKETALAIFLLTIKNIKSKSHRS